MEPLRLFARIYKYNLRRRSIWTKLPKYSADVIACVQDICNYIHDTHGRFPAHCDAIHVPGVWLQVHHVEDRVLRASSSATDLRPSTMRTIQNWH